MTENIPSTPSSIAAKNRLDGDLNPKHLAMGETWARAFSARSLTDAERQAVAREYAQLLVQPRTQVFHHEVEGRRAVLVQLGRELQVVDRGQLWAWPLTEHIAADEPQALTAETLWQAHQDHLNRHTGIAKDAAWLLHSFCQAAYTLAKAWADQDIRLAFQRAQVRGGPGAYFFDPAVPQKIRLVKGYRSRTLFYVACIGKSLRPLREALPREVRRTLWSIRCPKGRLAHWVIDAPSEQARLYRCQALRVQPLLLPQALYGLTDRWAFQQDSWAFERSPDPELDKTLQSLGKRLDECVDLGRPFHQPLLEILGILATPTSKHAQAHHKERGMPTWSEADFRFLSGRPIHQTLTFVQVNRHHTHELAPAMVQFVRRLEPARRPRTPKDWNVVHKLVGGITRITSEHSREVFSRSEAFLKGCPLRWEDPFYAKIERMILRVDEALDGLGPIRLKLKSRDIYIGEVMGKLSFRQWINLGEHFHRITGAHDVETHERLMMTDTRYRQTHQDLMIHCKWPASLRQRGWIHGSLRAHELRSLNDTRDEGTRMDHCAGNSEYALGCAEGQWRLFSFRDAITDAPVSTVQLEWDAVQRKVFVRQHLGIGDTPPPREAVQALRALLRSDQLIPGPWPINRKVQRLREGLELIELKTSEQDFTRLGKQLWNDVRRRYPRLIPEEATF